MNQMIKLGSVFVLGLILGWLIFTHPLKDSIDSGNQTATPDVDPYLNWQQIKPGGVVTLMIPPGCTTDAGAGSTFIICTKENETGDQLPSMVVSSDGITVNIRRWENAEWDYWDQVIASLKVITPVNHDISINVQA